MVTEYLEKPKIEEQEIIKTQYWELPVDSLEGWRPYTAVLDYRLFLGPSLSSGGRGLSLHKDLMGGIHGARGAGKSMFLSFLLAKKMRSGKPVWTNYPISFYVQEADGELTYYESRPLDFDAFYTFSREVRNGAVGITELQYYVEARTSGREQNRIMTYQIMQIRKTALSMLYDVQDRTWVDKRFGWSNDFDIECSDIAKMNYDRNSVRNFPRVALNQYKELREGAYIRFTLEDTSGVLTGTPFKKNKRQYGPYQFAGWKVWDIYPTHFIVDVYEAVHSLKKKDEKASEIDELANALRKAIDQLLEENEYTVPAPVLWDRTRAILGRDFSPVTAGRILGDWQVPKKLLGGNGYRGKQGYLIGNLMDGDK